MLSDELKENPVCKKTMSRIIPKLTVMGIRVGRGARCGLLYLYYVETLCGKAIKNASAGDHNEPPFVLDSVLESRVLVRVGAEFKARKSQFVRGDWSIFEMIQHFSEDVWAYHMWT